jgi:hypothetical protein
MWEIFLRGGVIVFLIGIFVGLMIYPAFVYIRDGAI